MTAESLIRMAHAQLVGLQENIPEKTVGKEYIDLFHSIVDDLESLNAELSSFRVPNSAINIRGHRSWCESHFLKAKVSGLLTLFAVSENKQKIGFIPSN